MGHWIVSLPLSTINESEKQFESQAESRWSPETILLTSTGLPLTQTRLSFVTLSALYCLFLVYTYLLYCIFPSYLFIHFLLLLSLSVLFIAFYPFTVINSWFPLFNYTIILFYFLQGNFKWFIIESLLPSFMYYIFLLNI